MTCRKILTGLLACVVVLAALVWTPAAHAESGCHKGTERPAIEPPRQ